MAPVQEMGKQQKRLKAERPRIQMMRFQVNEDEAGREIERHYEVKSAITCWLKGEQSDRDGGRCFWSTWLLPPLTEMRIETWEMG